METRLERSKKKKSRKRIRRFKFLLLLILFGFMIRGLMVVDQDIIDLQYLEDSTMFNFDLKTRKLTAFGKSYIVDLKILKEVD